MSLYLLVSSILQSNGGMDTRSKPTYVLLGHPLLFDSMLFALFTCLACFVCLRQALLVSVFFACSPYFPCFFLCLSVDLFLLSLHVHGWSIGTWSKGATSQAQVKMARMQARRHKPKKGNVQQIRRPNLLKQFSLSLSSSLFSKALYQGFLSMYPLSFLHLAYATFLGYSNVCFTFLVPC